MRVSGDLYTVRNENSGTYGYGCTVVNLDAWDESVFSRTLPKFGLLTVKHLLPVDITVFPHESIAAVSDKETWRFNVGALSQFSEETFGNLQAAKLQ